MLSILIFLFVHVKRLKIKKSTKPDFYKNNKILPVNYIMSKVILKNTL